MSPIEREIDGIELEHHDVVAGDVRLHVVTAGAGEPVLLLHGFPDTWITWRRTMAALVGAGRRVVAPELRGYGRSEKPHGIDAYSIDALTGDLAHLAAWAGGGPVDTVGHDWGAIVAWYAAMHRPDAIRRLAILNVPHPEVYRAKVFATAQWRRSWYGAVFQIPWLPERLLGARRAEAIVRAHVDESAPGTVSREELDVYRETFSVPGALTSAIHYYRMLARPRFRARLFDTRKIDAPTLLLWGEHDPFLVPEVSEGTEEWVENLDVVRFPDAGHWVHRDAADGVHERLLAFLGGCALASADGAS